MKANKVKKHPFEIFEQIQKTKTAADRITILQENESYELKTILQGAFCANLVFDIPMGAPPFTPSLLPAGILFSSMRKQLQVLPKLLVQNTALNKNKKERLFILLLENVHASDAEILIAMKDKSLHKKYSFVTAALASKAFDNLGI